MHQLVDTVTDYSIFMLDPTGHVATWNAGARRTKGYAAAEIPSIALAANAREEDRSKALRAGFTSHLGKPVNASDLVAAVVRLAPPSH